MTKNEIKEVVDEMRQHKTYPDVSTEPLFWFALSDFPTGKFVRKEVIVNMLNWQCACLDGSFDD